MTMPVILIVGVGSDIGRELAVRYLAVGCTVWGTHRGAPPAEAPAGVRLLQCDLGSTASIAATADAFIAAGGSWDVLVVAAGTEEPIGTFWECQEDEWDMGQQVNALGPLRLLRRLYPHRNAAGAPCVAFFSGSGTNNAAPAYSSYCVSKILLIKMCELLDAESPDTSFFILGPGIVRTKIHEQTLRAPGRSGANLAKVVSFLASEDPGTSHDDIFELLGWCARAGKSVVGGRNLSLVWDPWRDGGARLAQQLQADPDLFKLRRFGNDRFLKEAVHEAE